MIEYDQFMKRQFSPTFAGTKIPFELREEILKELNESSDVLDSAWDFCKYVVIPNTFGVRSATMPITLEIYPFIRSDYSSRTPEELPILSRFVQMPPGISTPNANFLVAVLYSREQLLKEFKPSIKYPDFLLSEGADWGIVALMGTEEAKPDPLVPITIMRNALGIDEGGNGEVLDRESYKESVEFWSKNILVK